MGEIQPFSPKSGMDRATLREYVTTVRPPHSWRSDSMGSMCAAR